MASMGSAVRIASALPTGANNIGTVGLDTGSNVIGAVKKDDTNYTKVVKDVQSADASASAATIWDPTTGTKFVMTDLVISVGAALTVDIDDGTSLILKFYMAANTTVIMNFQTPIQSATADNLLTVQTSGAGNISVTACGYEV